MTIILCVVSLVLGVLGCYFILKPKLTLKEKLRADIIEQNKQISQVNKELTDKQVELLVTNESINKENEVLKRNTDDLLANLDKVKSSAEQASQSIYEQSMKSIQESISIEAVEMGMKFQEATDEFQDGYLQIMEESAKEYSEYIQKIRGEIADARLELDELASRVSAAVAANIREEEKKNGTIFYSLGISDIDIQEVKKLREIIPYLRNSRPVSKIIWESYYRNATTDLVNRVVGAGTHTGIYRITCLLDNKIYIGQAMSIGDRLKQHIKCGLGIDTPQNKLYQAMMKQGVENFTFEVIEECPSSELNKQEKYWIEFYQSNVYGYNMSSGGARKN